MTVADRIRSADVTLGELARVNADHFGVSELDVKRARAVPTGIFEGSKYLEVHVLLPDRRPAWLGCSHDNPAHVINLKLL